MYALEINLRQGGLRVMGKGSKERLVPLGEEAELYTVRLVRGGEIVHEDTVSQPLWLSRENEISAEVLTSPMLEVHVAQVSALFGPGPFARIMLVK